MDDPAVRSTSHERRARPTRPAPTDVPIHPLLAGRWSPRGLDPDRSVDPADVRALLEAARWAPSNGNVQPWRFVVADDEDPAARERLRDCLHTGNAWAHRAPVLLLSLAAREFPAREDKPSRENPYAWHDVGAATLAAAIEATSRGLGLHPMAGFDRAAAAEAVGAPEGLEPVALLALGHPAADPRSVPDELVERDARPRTRTGVDSFVWRGHVGGPAPNGS
ncbi:nitroreductase [Egibacter rhizosphaerae]|uniref:Nitroreductase n=1 Tax=Egibacter rhizosphaerae TaxID=1670831 RepID=A0A411YAD2_9ACTN|nr:nitroreductase family protein [Egibacter rhizosphaerae]QBI18155.1 nitroreductase [Egibacter rhizosphaerae]